MFKYGIQTGVIVYGGGINVNAYVQEQRDKGKIVIKRDGFATIHEPHTGDTRKK